METQPGKSKNKINRSSTSSLVAGSLSVILYVPLYISLSTNNEFLVMLGNAIPIFVYLFGGIIFSVIGLSLSAKAFQQINHDTLENRSRTIAWAGRILSIAGIIIDIASIPIFMLQ